MPELTTVDAPALVTRDAVLAALPLGERPTSRAAAMALARLVARANARRRDLKQPPLRGIRVGRQTFYREDFAAELLRSL